MIKQYPNLGETLHEKRLDNGLLVRVVQKPGFSKAHAFLAVDYGSIDTKFSKNGINYDTPLGVAHYLEHKMFDMPEGNIMQMFSQYGGNPNAFTSYDITAYYVECAGHFYENLKLLLSYVFLPYFTEESVNKERGIIGQEIRMYEDNPDSRVFENLYAAMYKEHPIRNSIAGSVESIDRITAQTLYDCYHGFYVPENMMLCVVGAVDPERVFQMAEEMSPKTERNDTLVRDYGAAEVMSPVTSSVEYDMEVSMPMFSFGFKTEPAAFGAEAMLQEIIGDLAAEMLMGESSVLYTKLYEKNLIDSSFSCGYEGLKGMSMLVASGDSADPDAVCAAVLEEMVRLEKDGLDRELFQQLKRSALGRRMRDLDSFDSICYRMCAYRFEGVDYYDFPDIFRSVTFEQVVQFLKRTVTEDRMALSVIKPKG